MVSREQGEERAKEASDSAIYKIEVPANRYVCRKMGLGTRHQAVGELDWASGWRLESFGYEAI